MSDRFFVLDKTAPDYEDRLRAELDRIEDEQPAKFFIGDREVTAAEFSDSIMRSMNRVAAAQDAAWVAAAADIDAIAARNPFMMSLKGAARDR